MDKQAARRWGPTIKTMIETLTVDEATDAILLLLEAPGRSTEKPAAPSPAPGPIARRLHTVGNAAASPAGTPPSPSGEPEPGAPSDYHPMKEIDPNSFYTVDQTAAMIGVAKPTIYGVLRDDPEKLPYTRNGERGEYMIRGRGIIAYKADREKKRGGSPNSDAAAHAD